MMRRAVVLAGLLGLGCDPSSVASFEADETGVEPSGELVFLEEHGPPDFRVATLELATREVTTLFSLPSGAFAYALDVHPETGAVLLAYTEPPAPGEPGFDRSVLVELHEDGPHHVLGDDLPDHWALRPRWSADGESIWYVALGPGFSSDTLPHTLVRASAQTGAIEHQIPWATEPAVSPRGDHVAWVAVDPATQRRSVVLASAAGEPIRTLVHDDAVYDLGLPTFSADGRGVFVLVLEDAMIPRSAALQASPQVQAHGVHLQPADWYGIAIDDTELVPVSGLSTIQYDATVSLEDWTLVAATREGLDLVHIESGESERLSFNRAIRAVAWRATP